MVTKYTEEGLLKTDDSELCIVNYLLKKLVSNGMFLSQAQIVIQLFMEKEPLLEGRWLEKAIEYDPGLLNMMWSSLKDVAYDWLVENNPKAWFLPLFKN